MEFFPLAAVGIGMAAIGTLLLLFLVMLFRTRLTSASGRRGSRNQQNNSSSTSHHPLEKPNSLMLTSGLTATTCTTNTNGNTANSSATLTNSAGYRSLPQSKSEADANPDIIPGANNYSADYKEELQRTLSKKGMYMSPSGQPQGSEVIGMNGQHNPMMSVYSNTLPKPRPPPPNLMTPGNGTTTGGGFHHHQHPPPPPPQPSSHHYPNPAAATSPYQTLHHPKSNYVKDYPPSHYHPHHSLPPQHHSPLPPNDYNTIYIRDKLLHDSDIPESCV